MSLQRFLLRKFPGVVGLLVILGGAGIIWSAVDSARQFHAFEHSKALPGTIISARGLGGDSDVDIDISWPKRGKDAQAVVPQPAGKPAGKRHKPPAPPAPVPPPEELEVTILHRVPREKVQVTRNGVPLATEMASLQEGDLVDILVSENGESVIFASERPPGMEAATTMTILGTAFLVLGVTLVLFRKKFSQEL